jgi:hypothetical protein
VKTGRNDLCPCGSGKKFKKCCLSWQQAKPTAAPVTPRVEPCPCDSGKELKECCKDRTVADRLNDRRLSALIDRLRREDPERFLHEERHTAFHEAGHALMNMVFCRDLERVTITPFLNHLEKRIVGGVCVSIKPRNDVDGAIDSFEQTAIGLAGKVADEIGCTCGIHEGSDSQDQKGVASLTANVQDQRFISAITTAVVSMIQRHRAQLDAIVEALIERKTLTGAEVFKVMVGSGWNPDDSDREQFCIEAHLLYRELEQGPFEATPANGAAA